MNKQVIQADSEPLPLRELSLFVQSQSLWHQTRVPSDQVFRTCIQRNASSSVTHKADKPKKISNS